MLSRRSSLVAIPFRAWIAAGIVVGMGGAVAVARVIADLLFGVAPHDPVILATAAAILLAFAAAANWFPARRAARVDPMRSLRAE